EVGLLPPYERGPFAPNFAFVSGGPIRKDAATIALQPTDLGPGWYYAPGLPPGVAIGPGTTRPPSTPAAWADPPAGQGTDSASAAGPPPIRDPGASDPVWLQVLQHGLVNRFTINYAQLGTSRISTVLVQQTDA